MQQPSASVRSQQQMGACLLAMIVVAGFASAASAQGCENAWLPGEPLHGTNARIQHLTVWRPQPSDPTREYIVAAGEFTRAGTIFAPGIAMFDRVARAWLPMGSGFADEVVDLATGPSGVFAVTQRTNAQNQITSQVFRWDGASWLEVGESFRGVVRRVEEASTLVAVGQFQAVGATQARGVAQWNGTSWVELGGGVDGRASSVLELQNGELVVGGQFASVGGDEGSPQRVIAQSIAAWNGTSWRAIGEGVEGDVRALTLAANGELLIAGKGNDPAKYATDGFIYRLRGETLVLEASDSIKVPQEFVTGINSNPLLRSTWAPDSHYLYSNELDWGWFDVGLHGPAIASVRDRGYVTAAFQFGGELFSRESPTFFGFMVPGVREVSTIRAGTQFGTVATVATVELGRESLTRSSVSRWDGYAWQPMLQNRRLINALADGSLVVTNEATIEIVDRDTLTTTVAFGDWWSSYVYAAEGTSRDDFYVMGHFQEFRDGMWGQRASVLRLRPGMPPERVDLPGNGSADRIFVDADDQLLVEGTFQLDSSPRTSRLIRQTPEGWVSENPIATNTYWCFAQLPDRSIVGFDWQTVYRRTAQTWSMIARPNRQINCYSPWVVSPAGELMSAFEAQIAPDIWAWRLHALRGGQWVSMHATFDGPVFSLAVENDTILVGGSFGTVNGVLSSRFARFAADAGCTCDSIDFNRDGVSPSDEDVVAFFATLAGQTCFGCSDIDFNNDGLFPSDQDIVSFLRVYAGGDCRD
jgi:hypothetical protein